MQRGKLFLPQPMVSDRELEQIAKGGDGATEEDASSATSTLLGNYTPSATPTPLRTPATPASQDVVMEEVRNAIARNEQQTPLLGGESAEVTEGTGFASHVPNTPRMRTPSSLALAAKPGATPLHTPGHATPGVNATPLRDSLGINRDDLDEESEKEFLRRQQKARGKLKMQLGNLPEPQYEYSANVPAVPEFEENEEMELEEDAEEREKRLARIKKAKEEAEFKRR